MASACSKSYCLPLGRCLRSLFLLALVFAFICWRGHKSSKPKGGTTRFSYLDARAKAVFLAGEFNHWSTTATPMQSAGVGKWSTGVVLPPGKYQYKFVADGRWVQDLANPHEAPDGMGGQKSVVTVIDTRRPQV